ncbi:Ig-like domain containing protein [Aeromonas phage AerS_266]|nr:Ig-like domain containing protein [Aeromonas phage AerS_266]
MFKNVNEIVQYKEQIKQAIRTVASAGTETTEVNLDVKEIHKQLRISLTTFSENDKAIRFGLIMSPLPEEMQIRVSETIGFFTELNFFANGNLMEESVDACYELIFITFINSLVKNSVYVRNGNFKGNLFLDFLKSGKLNGLHIKSTAKTVNYVVTNKYGVVVWETTMSNKTGNSYFNVDAGYFNNVLTTALTMTLLYNEDNWNIIIPTQSSISLS